MELARLQRDVQVLNGVYLVLTQQYETALIAESKESDAFLVLDPPRFRRGRSVPRRSSISCSPSLRAWSLVC